MSATALSNSSAEISFGSGGEESPPRVCALAYPQSRVRHIIINFTLIDSLLVIGYGGRHATSECLPPLVKD